MNPLMDLACGAFNNRERVEEVKKTQGKPQRAQLLVAALAPAPPGVYPTPCKSQQQGQDLKNLHQSHSPTEKEPVLNTARKATGSSNALCMGNVHPNPAWYVN